MSNINFDITLQYNFEEDFSIINDLVSEKKEQSQTFQFSDSWKFDPSVGFRPAYECKAPIKRKRTGDCIITTEKLEPVKKRLFS
jgi:hypothetical protein